MITKQHTALTLMALAMAEDDNRKLVDIYRFREMVPWILLPDAIRAYVGPRQAGHHEEWIDEDGNKQTSWMEYPCANALKKCSKETAEKWIKYHVVSGIKPCVIGEATQIDVFDEHNNAHYSYHLLRTHLLQDIVLDNMLRRNFVDVSGRFEDRFVIKHNGKVIDGKELRRLVALYEEVGFIHLIGAVFNKTGILLTREWFDENVYPALLEVYPKDLADNTYKYMVISDEVNERIKKLDFTLTQEEIDSVGFTDELMYFLDDMYLEALYRSIDELKLYLASVDD